MIPLVRILGLVALIAAVVYLIWWRPLFKIQIREGRVLVRFGKVSQRFLAECNRLLASREAPDGWIRGVRRDDGVALRFSRSIPESLHQPIRNLWAEYR
jgi:hypothetical protein